MIPHADVQDELRRLAHSYMAREQPGHTLQTTALLNEAYLRLVDSSRVRMQNRAHFFKTGTVDLWLRELAGTGEVQLTFEGTAVTPQWSPDGSRNAYSAYGQRPPPKLYMTKVTGERGASQVGDSVR